MILSATDARANFFDILNRALYGGEDIYITKAGADKMIKLKTVSKSREILDELAGSWSGEEADKTLKAIKKARSYPKRKVLSFDK